MNSLSFRCHCERSEGKQSLRDTFTFCYTAWFICAYLVDSNQQATLRKIFIFLTRCLPTDLFRYSNALIPLTWLSCDSVIACVMFDI